MTRKRFQSSTELTAEDRELLAYLLEDEGIELSDAQTISPRDRSIDPPLSFGQQRLWFLDSLNPGSPFYNVAGAVRLTGSLDTDVLKQCMNEIVSRHEAVRTTFATIDDHPVQIIAPPMPVAMPVIDLSHLPDSQREEQARQAAVEESASPFDLAAGPLLRLKLLRLAPQQHLLLLTMHHIICDGWSVGVFVKELAALYEAFLMGKPSPLPALPAQYADFAAWQRQWMQEETQQAQFLYWEKQLAGAPDGLEMPTDRPRPPSLSFQGARRTVSISQRLTDELSALSRREGATLFMTMDAALKTLLNRYSGQEDISTGTPVANRNVTEIEGLIGFFANTLVMRTDLSGDVTFLELLAREKEAALGAYANQDVPFEQLIERLKPARDLSRPPFFQVMLALENTPKPTMELPGVTLSVADFHNNTAKFDLTLFLEDLGEGLTGWLEYSTDLFDDSTIARIIRNFETLLEGIAANPDRRISQLPIFTGQEFEQIVVGWNDTAKDYGRFKSVSVFFEEQVERAPDAVAAIYDDKKLTYSELNRRANQLAHLLRRLGVKPDVNVGLCAERSIEMAVGVMGIVKSGGVYVPIDPAYPKDRQTFMLEDTQSPVLLTQQHLFEGLPETDARIICLDSQWGEIAGASDENFDSGVEPENLVYIVYTSGSTGKPKGVAWSHESLTNMTFWLIEDSRLSNVSNVVNYASLSFDVSSQELFAGWSAGAALIFMREETRRDAELLLKFLSESKGERLFIPFVALQQLAELSELHPQIDLHLRDVITAGEQLQTTKQIRRFFESLERGYTFNNFYGPSEGNIVTVYQLEGEPECWPVLPSIGKPISNTAVYVLDKNMNPVPVGASGELYIGGVVLARGYLNRPDLTAEKFIPAPFAATEGARVYKTGDLARYLPDGNLEFLGRIDHQVKIRGYRVELGEIEVLLAHHPSITEAVVVAREDSPGQKRLVAYIIADPVPPVSELRGFLKDRLPEYMMPSAFVFMDEFPLSPNRKVDRKALPAPDQTRADTQREYEPPRNQVEAGLAKIWAELLRVEKVGIHDNFFELGGHSLLATQVVSRIKSSLSAQIPLRALFEDPTVSGLASRVKKARASKIESQALAIKPVSRDQRLPLSFAQQRLWFFDQLEPNSPFYNVPGAIRLTGRLEAQTLRETFDQIILRHESLRTTFAEVEGNPVQVIAPSLKMEMPLLDLRTMPEQQREGAAMRLAAQEAQRPFDLAAGPLFRGLLIQLREDEFLLVVNMHHIISDGWSVAVLIKEVAAIYESLATGKPVELPPLPIQYADFAVWQRQWLQGEVLQEQLDYWLGQLDNDMPVLQLPTDRPRPATQSFWGDSYYFELPGSLREPLNEISRQQEATLFMALLAGFETLLYRYTGQEEIIVGMPIANRNRAEIEGLIGFFVNTLALRTELSGEPSFRELIDRVKRVTLEAYENQDLPFDRLVEELKQERDPSYPPVFQALFVFQNTPDAEMKLPDLVIKPVDVDTGTSKFDLTVLMKETDSGFEVFFEYNTALFDRTTIERMASHYGEALESAARCPEQSISKLEMLSHAERDQIIVGWNQTARDYEHYRPVYKQVESQVERTPDAVAVTFEGEDLSYRELNRRANQLARRLREMGVGPDVSVGVCVERSVEMVVGALAILKAGGAYVPIDPAYPKERQTFMLEDTQTPVLLTQQRLVAELPETDAQMVCLDSQWDEIATRGGENLDVRVEAENLHFIIYTSGSTGRPKGVAMSDGALENLLAWQVKDSQFGTKMRTLQFASLSFDVAFQEIFPTWTTGGTLVLVSEQVRRNAQELKRYMQRQEVEQIFVPFVALQQLAEVSEVEENAPASLKQIITAGEQVKITRQIESYFKRASHCKLHINYGPSENHATTVYHLEGEAEQWPELPPIGRPLGNVEVYLLDKHLNPVPVRVAGELYIGGVALARGYLNRAELTAERFLPNPYRAEAGSRMYRTGDLARWMADGRIEFLGRIDHQVKIRGFRVELGEIEAVLIQHEKVKEAVVVMREEKPGDKRLVAYFVGEEEGSELREYLRDKLPEYMLPHSFVKMEKIPLSPNGKVDRKSLPAPEGAREEDQKGYVAPRTEAEEALAEIWAKALGLERVGIKDNFFEIGGHSLLATQVVSRIKEGLGVQIALRALFEKGSLEELAVVLEEALASGASVSEDKIVRREEYKAEAEIADVEQLSDAEVDSMLKEMLAQQGD